jgi:hypothetical protein
VSGKRVYSAVLELEYLSATHPGLSDSESMNDSYALGNGDIGRHLTAAEHPPLHQSSMAAMLPEMNKSTSRTMSSARKMTTMKNLRTEKESC